ncbi:MAG: cobalt ECF transporter T component CbiQ [Anaerolineae bacterium]|nr:cobalt ECF transporter T component CbiQ [Anaerolineae bacterium]
MPQIRNPYGRFVASRRDFVAETLAEITEAIERTVFAAHYARLPGLLQAIDPRVKVLTFFLLLITTATARHLETLLGLYLLTLLLAWAARIPLGFFIKRVWVFIPIFAGVIAIPAIFNLVTPGRAVVILVRLSAPLSWGPIHIPGQIAITEQGLRGAVIFVTRVATSVSFAVLLVLTTEWTRLLKALTVLHFPQVGILILGMTYRYIFLLLRVTEDMFLARKSRMVGHTDIKEQHRWIAARLGFLLGKSYHLSNEVYLAMLSRGWNGQARLLDDFRLRWKDAAWTGFVVGVVLLVILQEVR